MAPTGSPIRFRPIPMATAARAINRAYSTAAAAERSFNNLGAEIVENAFKTLSLHSRRREPSGTSANPGATPVAFGDRARG